MESPEDALLAAVDPGFLQQAHATTVDDWLSALDPDGVVLVGTERAPQAMNTLRRHCSPETLLFDPTTGSGQRGPKRIDGVQFVFASTHEDIATLSEYEQGALDTDRPTIVVSDLLELEVDTTTLATTLLGKDTYTDALSPAKLEGEYVHISTQLPAEYRHQWDNLTIVGGGEGAGTGDTPLVGLTCRSDGRVLTHTLGTDRLGLQALAGVGPSRAGKLRAAGYGRRAGIASAEQSHLTELPGIGESTAQRIQRSAQAISRGEIVRTGTGQLPAGDPIFVDIETDGLSPTITWLIGVLDGADGNYLTFLQPNPDEPGQAVADFMAWYTANASHRPIVAYNGWGFDFEVLHEAIVEHCPSYEADWNSTYRFDPYQWAVKDGNAILPGRTNKLEAVADALGYERDEVGLTGAAVARRYRQWMVDRDTEPEWERFERYCEDDVRALATIYEALETSGRIVSEDTDGDRTAKEATETTQGTLSDW